MKWRELGNQRRVELYGIWQTEQYKPPPARNVSPILCLSVSLCVCLSSRQLVADGLLMVVAG